MKRSPPHRGFSAWLLLPLLALCGGCSRLSVEWTATWEAIGVTAHGPPNAVLVILAGPPTGPHFLPNAPEYWSTVGPSQDLRRIRFDASGVASARISAKEAPKTPMLLQAVALSPDEPARPLGVSTCMSLRWEDGRPVLVPHAADVLLSPVAARILLVAALVAAILAARRLEIASGPGRGRTVALVLACAATLLVMRAAGAPGSFAAARPHEPAPLFPPRGAAERLGHASPLDRVTLEGFQELVRNARALGERDGVAIVVDPKDQGDAYRATQAEWLLLPTRSRVVAPGAASTPSGGVRLAFAPMRERHGVRILFQNTAGVVWRPQGTESR